MSDRTDESHDALLSVVIVTPGNFQRIRRAVRRLHEQTIADRIELVVVSPSADAVSDMHPDEASRFAAVRHVHTGAMDNIDEAGAAGMLEGTADVVAIIEDHTFTEPQWAQAMLEAHAQGFDAVGSSMVNANPGPLSWANLLIAYGYMTPPVSGEVAQLAGQNVSFKRSIIQSCGQRFAEQLGRCGGLFDDLKKRGVRFCVPEAARLAHINTSRLGPTASLRCNAGRIYAAKRIVQEQWGWGRRLAYALLWPLLPLLRFKRVHAELLAGGKRPDVPLSARLGVFFALVCDGFGQMLGYLLGIGASEEALAGHELNLPRHITEHDRQRLGRWWAEPAPQPQSGKSPATPVAATA